MRGSIRIVVGLLVTLAAAGGMDNATNTELPYLCVIAAVGLFTMYSGVNAQSKL